MNPLLAVDQPQAQQRVSKKALARNNPLDPDYISGSSPFVVKARSLINCLEVVEVHCRFKLDVNVAKRERSSYVVSAPQSSNINCWERL